MTVNTLKNGATVLAKMSGVVLAKRDTEYQPYVTWMINRDGDTYWGHYFNTEEEAAMDWADRVTRVKG